jgi:hypothetical protein
MSRSTLGWRESRSHVGGLAVLLLVACGPADTPDPNDSQENATDAGAAESTSVADLSPGDAVAPSVPAFSDRVAVFMEASPEVLDSILSRHVEGDREIVADDAMYYRSSAYDFFDREGIRVVSLEGRTPLRFQIDGALEEFDFAAVRLADVIVLYDPGKAPRAIAPAELHLAQEYFELSSIEP